MPDAPVDITPDLVKPDVTEGPGSKTPSAIPSLHTELGGGDLNLGDASLGESGRPAGTPPAPPIPKTPEQLLDERSVKSLKRDLEDVVRKDYNSQYEQVQEKDISKILSLLVDKGWRVDRLKELLPSRKQEDVHKFFNDILSEDSNTNLQDSNVILPNNNQNLVDRGINMGDQKAATLVVEDGQVKVSGVTGAKEKLASLANTIRATAATRKKLVEASIKVRGIEASDMSNKDRMLRRANSAITSILDELKEKLEDLSKELEGAEGLGDAEMDLEDSESLDALLEKGEDEVDASSDLIADFEDAGAVSEDSEKGENESEEKEGTKEAKDKSKDDKKDKGKDKGKGKASEKDLKDMGMADGKKKKSMELLDVLRQRIAEVQLTKEALYPDEDKLKQNVDGINEQTAKQQATTINSEIGKDPKKDKMEGFLGENKELTNLTPEQAKKLSAYVAKETTAKIRYAMDIASQQQLKGLIANPLREALVKGIEAIGVTAEVADAIVHNAYIEAYEPTQTAVIHEAFETLAVQNSEELKRVASFTKDYTLDVEGVQAPVKEASADETSRVKQASSAVLRPAVTGKDAEEFKSYFDNMKRERYSHLVR